MPSRSIDLEISSAGVSTAGGHVDVAVRGAAARLRELLGPVVASDPIPRVPRTVGVLQTGIVLLVESATDELASFVLCFQSDANPYPSHLLEVPVFRGTVICPAGRLVGGELEGKLRSVPGVTGFGGGLEMSAEALHLGFNLQRPRNNVGKRSGTRRLTCIVAEWGGVKPFALRRGGIAIS